MKLSITNGEYHGASCLRAVAVINKSKKLGIPKRRQKTWSGKTIRPDLAAEELKTHLTNLAAKWEKKILAQFAEGKKAVFVKQPEEVKI